jgi:hypothetical protein
MKQISVICKLANGVFKDNQKMRKGVTLSIDELRKLKEILNNINI